MTVRRCGAAGVVVLAALALAAPVALAYNQPQPPTTYIWNGHSYTRHPPTTLQLAKGVRLTNIDWGSTGAGSAWGDLGVLYDALISPSHWYRTSLQVETFDTCSGGKSQYVLTVGVYLPSRRIPASPLGPSAGRAHLRMFALPVPAC